MAARADQIDQLQAAASYLTNRQNEVMPQFRLQQVTVQIMNDPEMPENGYAEATFTWSDGHYNFTVS